jgi:hypothetical protein
MLSYQAVVYLETFRYENSAERMFPLFRDGGDSSHYAIPDLSQITSFSEDDQLQIWKLFAIRIGIWRGLEPSESDQAFWDMAQRQVPDSQFFQVSDPAEDVPVRELGARGF